MCPADHVAVHWHCSGECSHDHLFQIAFGAQSRKNVCRKKTNVLPPLIGNPLGMGYAGYVSAKFAERKTSLQLALFSITSSESLDVLSKLLRNTAVSPAGLPLNKQS